MISRSRLPGETLSDVDRVVTSLNRFAISLYARLAAQEPGNIVFSPSSVAYALAMAYAGASGETAREIATALELDLEPARVHEALRELHAQTRTGGIELRIAYRLWGQRGYAFLRPYLELTERCYGAPLAEVDFQDEPEQARQQINAWVAERTAERIREIIPAGAFSGPTPTRLIITNATYFLGTWESKFEEEATRERPFWVAPGRSSPVAMMAQQAGFAYGERADCQILEMPYQSQQVELVEEADGATRIRERPELGSDFAMTVLLPKALDGLAALEAGLSAEILDRLSRLGNELVNVEFPK